MKTTDLGYPVLSDELHHKVFGNVKRPSMTPRQVERAKSLLREFNVSVPVDYPSNMYDGDLPTPPLLAENIKEHYEKIADNQIGHYKGYADRFAETKLPEIPPIHELVFLPGWTRYEKEGDSWVTRAVDYPEEDAFTFDTETFVYGGAFPIIGTAISEKAAYIWLAKELIDPSIPVEQWDQFELIPIGENRFVAGHNISYDRVRAREGYSLSRTKPENFYFDTLSAHIGVSGLASGQRWLYVLATKDPDALTEEEKRKLRYAPKWFKSGSTNSLVQCYNFHVHAPKEFFGDLDSKPLSDSDKEVRDIFVKATNLGEIRQVLAVAVDYAIKDAYYTAELFQALWPKYLDSTPSMVALCGHYHLNASVIPLTPDWEDWIKGTEEVFNKHNEEMSTICKDIAVEVYRQYVEKVESVGTDSAREWAEEDPWLSQLDWEVKTTRGKYANVPNWYRPFVKDEDHTVGVKSNISHLLLRLKWENTPVVNTKDMGWCYHTSSGDLVRIPHPKKEGENVGGLFSKEFVTHMEVGRLSSDLPAAKRALEIANAISYWTSVRKRVMSRLFMNTSNPHGEDALVTLPEILCHGTVTRRTVEPLMITMCKTKNWRIGTELKTRITAPDGWKIVGADFDGQEMQIASIYSDKWEGGFVGCSPFGYNVLSGSKEAGTDPHSALARIGGVDRDLAKIVGFSILYGAALRAVMNYIRQRYPDKGEEEVRIFATRMLNGKKGVMENGLYYGGTDSGCFNFMEEIAMRTRIPTLPCLNTKISTAMRPSVVGTDFKTGRVNWTIQASGAEILSIVLTTLHWLGEEYKIPFRFVLSIHDELWCMVPERYAEQFAVVYQIAHMYTWALFHYSLGIPDLPLSRAFFSSVAIDYRIRKTPDECTVTPSHESGGEEPPGVEYSMPQLSEIGAVRKLAVRLKAVQDGLL